MSGIRVDHGEKAVKAGDPDFYRNTRSGTPDYETSAVDAIANILLWLYSVKPDAVLGEVINTAFSHAAYEITNPGEGERLTYTGL